MTPRQRPAIWGQQLPFPSRKAEHCQSPKPQLSTSVLIVIIYFNILIPYDGYLNDLTDFHSHLINKLDTPSRRDEMQVASFSMAKMVRLDGAGASTRVVMAEAWPPRGHGAARPFFCSAWRLLDKWRSQQTREPSLPAAGAGDGGQTNASERSHAPKQALMCVLAPSR